MAKAKVQAQPTSRAQLKFLRIPPRKARAVADLVRGKNVNEATAMLKLISKRGARFITDALNSAMANANQTGKVDTDNLFIQQITIDGGPIIKRFSARAQGRADRVQKRTSHITVVLSEK
jgi:large subunit ribosomal protein L22